jgi:peptidyl-dipeptidase Dcp
MPPSADNPLLAPWTTPFGLPPFAEIRPAHFAPAFDAALAAHRADIDAIAAATEPPTLANTVVALDRSGRDLVRIQRLFFNLAASETSPELQAIEREMAPRLAAHQSAIYLDTRLFARIDTLYRQRAELAPDAESLRLLERIHLDFVRAGAALPAAARQRMAAILERLATLSTRFSQNVLADEAAYQLVLDDARDLAGLPESVVAAAGAAARQRNLAVGWVITLSRSLAVPFLTFSDRRDLREQLFQAWTRRGENQGDHDNRPLIAEILALRQELARLHGCPTYADYALVDRMAGSPAAVAKLLDAVWEPACRKAAAECRALAEFARSCGATHPIEPWDWRYWAEKLRATRHGFDDGALKPYFSLARMQQAAFDTARRLFGIDFVPRPDLPVYHPDVLAYEVRDRDGRPIGVFLADNFTRPTKRGGAWMSVYRVQSRRDGEVLPIVVNNNNFARAPDGEPTLLSVDELTTLFHEFGHGLHGLLSNVRYERLSGTQVLRDFVEMPSQIFEHWAFEPAVLARHALHHATGEPIPETLLAKLDASRRFSQGFETVEYTACAKIDMALHALPDAAGIDLGRFEREELERIGMPREIVLRHRLPHFGHLFSSSGYAAGYYVYLWAEVLDADGYGAFVEAGDPFDPEVAARLLRDIYSSGATLDPAEAYRRYRGRDPRIGPMLAERGLAEAAAAR